LPTPKQILVFVAQWVLVGLACAAVVLWLRPKLFGREVAAPVVRTTDAAGPTAVARRSFADAVGRAAPAVVNIYTARVVTRTVKPATPSAPLGQNLPTVRQRVEGSLGSGVIVDTRGDVITNYHVIKDAAEIGVQLADGRTATPTIVGTDPDTDIAVLRVDLDEPPVMPMGRSDELRAGDVVLAIGNPFGLSQTVTQGIVSATGRGQLGVTQFEDFIQTDAAINFGNSGGALINADGELIGINTAVLAQQLGTEGIGFAIPVNLVRGVMEEILAHGRVRRGALGVTVTSDPTRPVSPPVIAAMTPNGPAVKAGLHVGDLITHVNGQLVANNQDALNRIAATLPGTTIEIRVRRGSQSLSVRTTLDERPPRGDANPRSD
jgi:serine protease DegS